MRQPIALATDAGHNVSILSVTPYEDDHFWLQQIIGHAKWALYKADRVASALTVLRQHEVGVILSENDLRPHSWTDILDAIHHLQDAPAVIVTSRLADDQLWTEALNLGAYDVLAKPFNQDNVLRSVSLAWLNWHGRHEIATGPSSSVSEQPTHQIKIPNRTEALFGHETVEAMAYQLWLLRRCPVGSDQEDWYKAEAELTGKHQASQHAA